MKPSLRCLAGSIWLAAAALACGGCGKDSSPSGTAGGSSMGGTSTGGSSTGGTSAGGTSAGGTAGTRSGSGAGGAGGRGDRPPGEDGSAAGGGPGQGGSPPQDGPGGGGATGGVVGQTGGTAQAGAGGGTGGAGGQGGGVSPRTDASASPPDAGGPDAVAGGGKDAGGVVGHPRRMILCDEGNKRVLLVDLDNPGAGWRRNYSSQSLRDIQLVGGDRVAVSIAEGYIEIDIKTGEVKKEVKKFSKVESIRRLPNGNTVLASDADGTTLQEVDANDTPVAGRKISFSGLGPFRMFRRTPKGTFLLGVGKKVAEVNWDRQVLWEMTIPAGNYVYQGVRLADGTVAVTSGYGATLVLVDPASSTVRATLGGKSQPEAAAIQPNFYAGFQVLANGNFVVTNWEGHGGGNGGKGIQLLEYDAAGTLVWRWKQDATLVSSLHHVIVLDGLDTTKLHDDVGGVLAPVTQ